MAIKNVLITTLTKFGGERIEIVVVNWKEKALVSPAFLCTFESLTFVLALTVINKKKFPLSSEISCFGSLLFNIAFDPNLPVLSCAKNMEHTVLIVLMEEAKVKY